MSILPTATQYARNAIFSGLMPNKIAEMFPELWVDEDEEEGKNLNEEPLIQTMLDRYRKRYSFSYHKVNDSQGADRFMEHYNECREKDLQTSIDAGMTVCEPDLTEWKEATQSVRDDLGTKIWGADGYEEVKAIAAQG